jgi:hypothetical protein
MVDFFLATIVFFNNRVSKIYLTEALHLFTMSLTITGGIHEHDGCIAHRGDT